MLWLITTVLASVHVTDATQCLDGNRLADELEHHLREDADQLDVTVWIHANDRARTARFEVRAPPGRSQRVVLVRDLDAQVEDCHVLPDAIAIAIQQALAELPNWDRPRDHLRARRGILRLEVDQGRTLRLGLGVGLGQHLFGKVATFLQGDVRFGPYIPVGEGQATLATLGVRAGLHLNTRRYRIWGGARAGRTWAVGRGFQDALIVREPHLAVVGGLDRSLGTTAFIGVYAESPIARLVLFEYSGGIYREARLRIGLSLGLRTPAKKRPPFQ